MRHDCPELQGRQLSAAPRDDDRSPRCGGERVDNRTFDTSAPKLAPDDARARRFAEIFNMKAHFMVLIVSLVLLHAAYAQECPIGEHTVGYCIELTAIYSRTKHYLFTESEELMYEFINKCNKNVDLIAAPQSGQTITKPLEPGKPTFLYCDRQVCIQYNRWSACSEVPQPDPAAASRAPLFTLQPQPTLAPNSTQQVPPSELAPTENPGQARSPSLEQLAHDALIEYYRRHGSDSGTASSGILDMYASQVTWYKGPRLSPSEILRKKINEVFNKWPTRTFSVRERYLDYDCDQSAHRCLVSGIVDFIFSNSEGEVIKDYASFELEFSDLTGRPKVSSEWSQREPVR